MKLLNAIPGFTHRPLELFWQGKKIAKLLSIMLIATFIYSMWVAVINHFNSFALHGVFSGLHFLQSSEISFTPLLFFEMISLVFVITQAIANSMGKQVEILCIVRLHSSLREILQFNFHLPVQSQLQQVSKMISNEVRSFIVLLLLSVYDRLQQHRPVTAPKDKV